MEIKGIALKSIPEFVQKHFPNRQNEWLEELPESSRKLFKGVIFSNNWYQLNDGLVIPMKTISKVYYFGDDEKTAKLMGKFHAASALSGIYKFFIQFGSPRYIIERAGRVFTTYFQPSEVAVLNVSKNGLIFHITKFPEPDKIIEYDIAGWMELALEKTGCKYIKIEIAKSLAKGDNITEFIISWINV
jgi:hypothetical protein